MSPELILPLGTISPWPDGGTATRPLDVMLVRRWVAQAECL